MQAEHPSHVLPLRLYFGIAAALLVLTVVTVLVSYIDLGGWNVVVALGVASLKGTLVALFFMHLKYDNKLNLFIFLAALFFVAIFIILTMFDTLRRADLYDFTAKPIQEQAEIYKNMPADSTQGQDDSHH